MSLTIKATAMGAVESLKAVGCAEPEMVRRLHEMAQAAAGPVVTAARAMIFPVVAGAALSAAALVVFVGLGFTLTATNPLPWVGVVLAAVPLVGLGIYAWVLMLAMRFPEALSDLSDRFCDALDRFERSTPSAIHDADAMPTARTGPRQYISTLIRYGRFALDLRNIARSQPDVRGMGPVKAVALMVSPPFWIGYATLLACSCLAAVLAVVASLLYYLFR